MIRLDPRIKLLTLLVGLSSLFLISRLTGQLLFLGFVLLLMSLNSVRLRQLRPASRGLWIFLPLTFLVHFLITAQGWRLIGGDLSFSPALLEQPLLFSLRLSNLLLWMSFGLAWLPAIDFLDALYYLLQLLRRLGWQSANFFQTIFIAVKYFPILQEEYWRLDEGWRLISGTGEPRLKARLSRVRKSVIPLLIFSFQKAETLADAMAVRGYQTHRQRSYYGVLGWQARDWLGAVLTVAGLLIVVIWR